MKKVTKKIVKKTGTKKEHIKKVKKAPKVELCSVRDIFTPNRSIQKPKVEQCLAEEIYLKDIHPMFRIILDNVEHMSAKLDYFISKLPDTSKETSLIDLHSEKGRMLE